jgi:zinc transporter 1
VSIFLEATQRLFEPQEVQNPRFVCIVGCFGLASNIVGLALFHDHSHGPGGGHDHGHDNDHEEHDHDHDIEAGGYTDHDHASIAEHGAAGPGPEVPASLAPKALTHATTEPASPVSRKRRDTLTRGSRRYSTSMGRALVSPEDIPVLPERLRQGIIAASQYREQSPDSDNGPDADEIPSERSGLLSNRDRTVNYTDEEGAPIKPHDHRQEDVHKSHNHAQPKPKDQKKGHGHDLNMRGVFLHVMGDALGNIGVIVSALVIWLTDYKWRFYVDPGISLVITLIILASAIPLCKAASRILLQAVPPGMSIDHIKEDIERLPGVIGSHHLHVWQLSDTKIVASIHIQVDTEIKGEGSERYMRLARQVRRCLHAYGIHSSTIQPEFAPDSDVEDSGQPSSSRGTDEQVPSRAASVRDGDPKACLLECDANCARGGQCCPKK